MDSQQRLHEGYRNAQSAITLLIAAVATLAFLAGCGPQEGDIDKLGTQKANGAGDGSATTTPPPPNGCGIACGNPPDEGGEQPPQHWDPPILPECGFFTLCLDFDCFFVLDKSGSMIGPRWNTLITVMTGGVDTPDGEGFLDWMPRWTEDTPNHYGMVTFNTSPKRLFEQPPLIDNPPVSRVVDQKELNEDTPVLHTVDGANAEDLLKDETFGTGDEVLTNYVGALEETLTILRDETEPSKRPRHVVFLTDGCHNVPQDVPLEQQKPGILSLVSQIVALDGVEALDVVSIFPTHEECRELTIEMASAGNGSCIDAQTYLPCETVPLGGLTDPPDAEEICENGWETVCIEPPVPGDVTLDGCTDFSDYMVGLLNFGITSGATLLDGDLECDGDVQRSDLEIILDHLGEGNC